ncbi:TolC family protein, partial [Acinetobacter baumannii]|nr:TolC family protein [Acinetobacter baumannii]
MTFTSQCIAIGLLLVGIQNSYTYASEISNFQDALFKVQQYQSQSESQLQRQQLPTLNIQNSRLWQNPVFSIEQNGFDSNQEQELSIGISQPLDVFGQRKINQKIALISEQQLHLQEQLWQAQSELVVKYAWAQYLLTETETTIFAKQLKLSQCNLNGAKKRYQAGSIA